jgi:hypothetical protein
MEGGEIWQRGRRVVTVRVRHHQALMLLVDRLRCENLRRRRGQIPPVATNKNQNIFFLVFIDLQYLSKSK